MARKKASVEVSSYSKLDEYCIWLNEYYVSLKRAGFKEDVALSMIQNRDSYPDWVNFAGVTKAQIIEHIEDTEEE